MVRRLWPDGHADLAVHGNAPSSLQIAGSPITPWQSFWQTLTRFDKSKVTPWLALRNALGFSVPLAVGAALDMVGGGLAVATGALNVSYSDSHDPYRLRARKMIASSILVGLGVCLGGLLGHYHTMAVLLAAVASFAAGMMVALGSTATDLGTISLVVLLVYSSVPLTPERAIYAGLLALAGGLVQAALALAFWPVRRYRPERRALSALYLELAKVTASRIQVLQAPPASAQSTRAQTLLAGLHRDHSTEAERYLVLLSEAERMRLSLLTLGRLRIRLERENLTALPNQVFASYFEIAAGILLSLGNALSERHLNGAIDDSLSAIEPLADELRATGHADAPQLKALIDDTAHQMDSLAGQLRAAVEVASATTWEGAAEFERRESAQPWRLQFASAWATLRANLSLNSASFRHAIRLAVCVAGGLALARSWDLTRSYWVPMTIAIVLKPDFTATFSRGVLRLAGTFIGLVLSTAIFHLLPPSLAVQIVLLGILMYLLRWLGPANYGIFVTVVTAVVVLMLGLSNVAPKGVISARALNTVVGGVIALLAYILWPTWERKLLPEALAQTLDAYRLYFQAIRRGYVDGLSIEKAADGARLAARLARSNLEASVDRFGAEPFTKQESIRSMNGILANSHRLVHALMALESGLTRSSPAPARRAFRPFANHVELTMYLLAAALRGSRVERNQLPDLRADHRALIHSEEQLTERYALVNVETDRITNSLNTLAEEVLQWIDSQK